MLVVDLIGKEFSGTGADPNITGRPGTPYLKTELEVGRLVYLALSPKSGGNDMSGSGGLPAPAQSAAAQRFSRCATRHEGPATTG